MRKNIPSCFIDNDSSALAKEFLWSLRYSTHCIYTAVTPSFDTDNYMYWRKEPLENSDLSISVKDNILVFDDSNRSPLECSATLSCNELAHVDFHFELLSVYVLSDFDGEIKIVGMIAEYDDQYVCIDHNSIQYSILMEQLVNSVSSNLYKNQLVRIQIKKGSLDIYASQKLDAKEFRFLRSCGINLALVIIQNLYERKVNTFKFLDNKYLSKQLDFERVYFDLDETLIWEGEAIFETITFLDLLFKKGIDLYLITRHKKIVENTLKLINVKSSIFNKIIVVKDGEKKSSFMEGKGLFIDNEFPERLDVMRNTKFFAIDIDQLEFFGKCIFDDKF